MVKIIFKKYRSDAGMLFQPGKKLREKRQAILAIGTPRILAVQRKDDDRMLVAESSSFFQPMQKIVYRVLLVPALVFETDEVGKLPVAEKYCKPFRHMGNEEISSVIRSIQAFPKDVFVSDGVGKTGLGDGLCNFAAHPSFRGPETSRILTKGLSKILPASVDLSAAVFRVTERNRRRLFVTRRIQIEDKRKESVVIRREDRKSVV